MEAGANLTTYETALLFAGKGAHLDVVEAIVQAGYRRTLDVQSGSAIVSGHALSVRGDVADIFCI